MENKLTEKQTELLNDLKSGVEEKINKGVDKVGEDGFSGVIPVLFDVFQATNDVCLQDKIVKVIMDVHNKNATKIIIYELESREWPSNLEKVLSAIWQSGLDYGPFLEDFVKFVRSTDLAVCVEALTCIEQFFFHATESSRELVRDELKSLAIEMKGHHRDIILIYLENLKK
jgi:hypothetical protein